MGFSRREYWSGLPFPPPVDVVDPGIEPLSLTSLALAGGFFTTGANVGLVCNFFSFGLSFSGFCIKVILTS